jgi:hypothetical protein
MKLPPLTPGAPRRYRRQLRLDLQSRHSILEFMILTFCSVALVDDLSYSNFVIEQFLNANREEVTALID